MSSQVWKGKRILIVDDSRLAREDLRSKFSILGLDIIGEANNGMQALELTHKMLPDIVSLDIIMPEMHGIEVFNRIRSEFVQINCCIVSCLSAETKVQEAYKEKYDLASFFNKPLDPEAFKFWLKKILEKTPVGIKLAG
jgi:two-component system chemotaxis response regulator CheY